MARKKIEPKLGRRETNKRRSLRQEDRLAELRGGRRVPASGALPGLPGDVTEPGILWEAKTTKKKSYSVTLKTLEKITREAMESGREPALQITFEEVPSPLVDKEWALVPLRLLPKEMNDDGEE